MPAENASPETPPETQPAMRIDHLSYVAGPEGLAGCVQRLGSRLGAGFRDGGIHPSFGTRNFVLALADGCYLEVVDVLDHPAGDAAPFGRAVRSRSADGGGWLAWVVGVTDMQALETHLGRPAAPGHRRRPDGVDLRWQQIGLNDVAVDAQVPFFVHWQTPDLHPSAGGGAIALRGIQLAADREHVERFIGAPADAWRGPVAIDWVEPTASTGLIAAVFATPRGEVTID